MGLWVLCKRPKRGTSYLLANTTISFASYFMFTICCKHYTFIVKRDGSVWQIGKCKQEYHETQKPVELIEKILLHSSDEFMTVFDPFMGSGTTGVACKNLNRNFIGIEMIKQNFEIAEKRILNHDVQLRAVL